MREMKIAERAGFAVWDELYDALRDDKAKKREPSYAVAY